MPSRLPEYDRPPVSEVALSVKFSTLANWQGPYAGVFWADIRDDYPHTQIFPPLADVQEDFDELSFRPLELQLGPADLDEQRTWFLSEDKTRLIQIQRDRFVLNWRKVKGDETYPRYENLLRPLFVKEWGRFRNFVRTYNLGDIDVNLVEATYVNDIVKGSDWVTFAEALELLSAWTTKGSTGFLPPVETFNFAGAYSMAPKKGRLHVQAQHVLRQLDQKEAIQLRLTARGMPQLSSEGDVMDWLDLAREWIVRGFTDLTSKKAHDAWGIKL